MCSYAKSWFVFKMTLATSFQHLQYVVKHIYAIVFIFEAYYIRIIIYLQYICIYLKTSTVLSLYPTVVSCVDIMGGICSHIDIIGVPLCMTFGCTFAYRTSAVLCAVLLLNVSCSFLRGSQTICSMYGME